MRQEIKLLKEGGANEDDLIAARSRYRGTSAEYARFSKAMDLPQQRERVTVDGLGNIGQGKYTKAIDKSAKSGIIRAEEVKPMINSIDLPIEQQHTGKGNPNAILTFGVDLNNRQKKLLERLPEYDSRIIVPKKAVNMADLSALTAKTGHEFAMFTKGNNRLIVRGNNIKVNINIDEAEILNKEGYRWSGHTHPGNDFICMQPSDGDYSVLSCFTQDNSVIYISKGDFRTFEKRGE